MRGAVGFWRCCAATAALVLASAAQAGAGAPGGVAGPGADGAWAAPVQVPVRLPGRRNSFAGCLLKSLSLRFDEERDAHRWAPSGDRSDGPGLPPLPLADGPGEVLRAVHLRLVDVQSGEAWDAVPDRAARSGGVFSVLLGGDRLRFFAGTMVPANGDELLEWHVLADEQPGRRVYHVQLAAPLGAPRRLQAYFWLGDAPFEMLRAAPPRTSISADGAFLRLDLSEPRRHAVLADAEGEAVGFRFDLGVTRATGNFPCTATFAVLADTATPSGGEGAPPPAGLAEEPLPLPEALREGDFSRVLGFSPATFELPDGVPAPATAEEWMAALQAAAEVSDVGVSEWATSAFQCLVLPAEGVAAAGRRCWVNPDPDLPAVLSIGPNRAQAVLYAVQTAVPSPGAVLFDFSALPAAPADTRERAVYLCDFPTVWADEADAASPLAVRLEDAAAEFAATMSCMLRRQGIPMLVAVDPASPAAPFLLDHADGVVVPPGLDAAACEALAGGRPVLRLPHDFVFWPRRAPAAPKPPRPDEKGAPE